MKKYQIFLWLTTLLSLWLLIWLSHADYELQIDQQNNEIYLLSGDTQITLNTVNNYAESLNKDLNLNIPTQTESWDTKATSTWENANWSGNNTNLTWNNSSLTGDNIETETEKSETEITTKFAPKLNYGPNVNAELLTGNEFDRALYRMYQNGLTKYNTEENYRAYDNLTREEAAKMIWQLYAQLWYDTGVDKWFNCNFVDTNMFDPTLSEHIYSVCKRGIFRWNDKTQQYMPHDNLTKGQLLAVLLRIFENKMSNESGQPRWIEYYIKAMTIWLTNETNIAKFDQPVSRWETALLIFRFKNMVIDDIQYELYLANLEDLLWNGTGYVDRLNTLKAQREKNQTSNTNTDNNQTDTTNPDSNWITTVSWSVAETWNSVSLEIIAGNETLTDSPEFIEAINRMYDMWMTSYNTTEWFMPYQTITRAQVAKMLDKFAIATNLTTIRNFWNCEFKDVAADSEFKESITRVCQYGIMAGSNENFSPDKTVSKAEFVAMLIRLFDWKTLDETLTPRWTEYYKRAVEIWLIWAQDTVTFTSEIARYEVAVFLYRLKVRLTMYNNLNSSQLTDEIVKTLSETQSTNENGKITSKVYIDILALNNSAFSDGYVEVLENRYRIKKSDLSNYNVWANSFVRYGTLYSLETWDSIGSVSFILTNGALVEGSIRIDGKAYYLSKDSATTTYYNLIEA